MMKHRTIHRKRLQNLLALLVSIVLIWLALGCSDDSRTPGQTTGTTSASTAETAAASLTIHWHDGPGTSTEAFFRTAALDCRTSNVENVVCNVYEASGNLLVTGGPWSCATRSGHLDRVPVGPGRTFVVLAEDANGDVRYHGETRGITIEAGNAPQSVVVDAYPFIPTLTAPEDNDQIDLADLSLEWHPLENAEEYLVQVAREIDFQTIVVDVTTPATPYAPADLLPSTPYFWRISAIDAHTNVSAPSLTRTFITSDAPAFYISGTIHTSDGAVVSGVDVTFSDGAGQTTTDTAGNFSKAVQNGWSGSVTPSKPGWSFDPASIPYENVTADQTGQDFTGTPTNFVITGVVEREDTGDAIADVTITFSDGSTVTTDAAGAYSKTVIYGWSGSATPSKPGWNFDPASITYDTVTVDQTGQNFTGIPTNFVITGVAAQEDTGDAIADVTITFSDGSTVTTVTTDAAGAYSKTVTYGWSGSASASKAGWNFSPASIPYDTVTADQTGQNFTGIPINFVISGVVEQEDTGDAIADAIITFSDGSTVTTDATGAYSKTVAYGWSGSASASKAGWNFNPASIPYDTVTADQTGQNFFATPVRPVIAGYVRDPDGNGLPGITLAISDSESITTDPSGAYRLEVTYGWSGSVTPTTAGYVYSPPSNGYQGVTADLAGQDFTATPIRPTISGYIRTDGNNYGMRGVTVTFSNEGGTASTDENGYYMIDLPYGWSGTAQPSLTVWQFAPPSRGYDRVTEDLADENYTGIFNSDDD
jgi:hypothetical protein